MRFQRLFSFFAASVAATALIGSCTIEGAPRVGLSAPGSAGLGGLGPHSNLGGSGGGGGASGTGDAGEPVDTVAHDDAYEVSAVAATTVAAPGLLENDTLGGGELLPTSVSTRLGGTVVIQSDGSFVYTPPANPGPLPRVDNFSYSLASDDAESSATVALTLVAPPLASDDDFGTLPNETLTLAAPGVLVNDEPNGARISDFDESSSEGGVVLLADSGALTYFPPFDFAGEDSFSYTLSNVSGSVTALVRISVDEAPLAAEDHYIGSKGQSLSSAQSLLANDSRGAPLATLVSFGGGSLGGGVDDHAAGTSASADGSQLDVGANGSFTFTPAPSLVGPFEFFYRLENSRGSSEARVVIDVHEAPLATDDLYDTSAGTTLTVATGAPSALLANDVGTPAPVITSFGAGSLSGTVADHAAGSQVSFEAGELTVNADGSFTFAATASASGEYSFDYHIENAAGQDEGTVRITVARAPQITSADTLTLRAGTDENLPFAVTASGTPEPVLNLDGELPEGVSFENGSLVGAADAESAGEYDVTVTASNGLEPDAVQTLTIVVQTEALLGGASTATFTVGSAGSYAPLVLGVPSPVLTLDGSLPSGLSFDEETGEISGTPVDGTGGVYPLSISADNGLDEESILLLTLEVLEAPELTSAANTTFVVGEAGSFELTSTGHPARTVAVSGTLPAGVSFNAGTATIAGTPADGSGGSYELDVTASNEVTPVASQSFTLTVNEAPELSGAAATTFRVGELGSYALTSSGFPAPQLGLSGSLPAGVSFDSQTGTLSGTPEPGSSGAYPLTFSASNGIGADASLPVTLNVDEGSSITSASATTFTVGSPGSFVVTASGTPSPTLSVAGTLPAGVSFTPATGVLAGTPAASTGGEYPLTFTASNGVGSDGTQSFTLTVHQAPALIGASTTTFTVGGAGSYAVSATGFPAPALGVSGALPDGVSFEPLTGSLSGTPAPGSGGSYPLTLSASNGVGSDATLELTLTVEEAAEITSSDEISFLVGTEDSFVVTATGTPAPELTLDESLPAGLTFTPETGVLEGTPAPGTGGEYTLTFSADNGVGGLAIQSATLTIEEPAGLLGAASTTFVVGSPNTYSVTRTGFPLATSSLDGSLPAGLSFSAAAGTISGTPQAGTAGTYPVTIGATNGVGSAASLAVTLQVNEAPSITSGNATTFTAGSPGTFTVTASGTPAPTFSATGLPSGVTLNASSGVLSGTPAGGTGGVHAVTLEATNGVAPVASQSFTLTVNEAPGISGATAKTFVVGASDNYTPSASGFPAPSFSLAGSLPSGLSFNTSTGAISGTPLPATGGNYSLTITANNNVGSTASLSLTLTVEQAPVITSTSAATFTVDSLGSFTVTATGFPAPSFSATGLPSGLSLNASSGLLSGTPAGGTGGVHAVTVNATNGVGTGAAQSFTLTVNEAPSLSGTPPSPVDADAAYSHAFARGGFPVPSCSVSVGTLPNGVTLDSTTCVLSGTPTAPGTFSDITVQALNSAGSDSITFSIVVNLAVPPPSATGEAFGVTGNIPIDVTSSVLGNDTLNGATITGFGASLASAATTSPGGSLTTNAGGSVVLAADGTFTYDPPAGVTGSDAFAYTIANAGGAATAQVSLTISNRVWFVDATAAPGGTGKLTSPYTNLTGVVSVTSGDVIYARRRASPYSLKALSSGQRLLGEGANVDSTHLGFSLAPFSRSSAFAAAGTSTQMRTLTLASGSYVRGMDVVALAGTKGLVASGSSSLDVSGMAVSASAAAAVELVNSGGTVSLRSVTANGGSNAIVLTNTTGSFTVTGDGTGARNGSGGTIQNMSVNGIEMSNALNVTLRSMTLQTITTAAVHGTGVSNFTAQGLTISGIGTGMDFDDGASGNANLTGIVSITGSAFSNATGGFFALKNFSGTISSLTIQDNSFTTSAGPGTEVTIFDSASVTSGAIKNNTYTAAGAGSANNAILVLLGRTISPASAPFARIDVEGNTTSGSNSSGIRLRAIDSNATLHTKVLNNSVTSMTSTGVEDGIFIGSGSATGDSTVCAQISGNQSVSVDGGFGIALRRQSSTGGVNDIFGLVGGPTGSDACPRTGATNCAGSAAVVVFIDSQNTAGGGAGTISAATGFSTCTLL